MGGAQHVVPVNKDIWQHFPVSFFYNKLQNLLQRQQYPQMQYPHELQLGCMPDLRFDDYILSRLRHQQEMTPHKCL